MRSITWVLMIALISISCSKNKTISEELVGEWNYERETFNSFSTFEDPDIGGTMVFQDDETGLWSQSNGVFDYDLEWDLQVNDEKIALTKYPNTIGLSIPFTTIYDLTRIDEDNFRLRFHIKFDSPIDTIESFEQFENIILERI
ncbi:MAG: hypothetical protein P1U56_12430 [Saprospiraceae bacterium]|nr:hypothetical protein [Saprospiraceae bacterium]